MHKILAVRQPQLEEEERLIALYDAEVLADQKLAESAAFSNDVEANNTSMQDEGKAPLEASELPQPHRVASAESPQRPHANGDTSMQAEAGRRLVASEPSQRQRVTSAELPQTPHVPATATGRDGKEGSAAGGAGRNGAGRNGAGRNGAGTNGSGTSSGAKVCPVTCCRHCH